MLSAMNNKKMTYVSLFSCAGIGCYGFKEESFECIATNELIQRRIQIQKYNNKCKYESGYICGDITLPETKNKILKEVEHWVKNEKITDVTVVMATPPCQGMSVANHKKNNKDVKRNSLVIESIDMIEKINPLFFIFENVPRFLKTFCIDNDEEVLTIRDAIKKHLGHLYTTYGEVINFKNYGSKSSRSRTLMIGVRNDYADYISPIELFPDYCNEITLKESIGNFQPLTEMGEISKSDVYHSFRPYPSHMRAWIKDLKEGESAFDNEDVAKKPHKVIDGKIIVNVNKNGDKYTRQCWNKVGPCIHTRNDQLASQNTIHPEDDRVFSIRELMCLMTIPNTFKWTERDEIELNNLSLEEKQIYLKKNEMNIRQCIGEAVPTAIIRSVAKKISIFYKNKNLSHKNVLELIRENRLDDEENLSTFLHTATREYNYSTLSKIIELSNAARFSNAAYFTDSSLITEIIKELPDFEKKTIRILEPSVGAGNFIPQLIKKYENVETVYLDLIDIDPLSIKYLREILSILNIPSNIIIKFIVDDFLTRDFTDKYDLVIGNPPFSVVKSNDEKLKKYRSQNKNKITRNTFEFFLEKAMAIGDYVSFVTPKTLIYAPEFNITRANISTDHCIKSIIDFGEHGFKKVLIETINIIIDTKYSTKKCHVRSIQQNIDMHQVTSYITDPQFPYWVIYRNEFFDKVSNKMDFDMFVCFRDRQITNKLLNESNGIKLIRSRNISDDGDTIIEIKGYDKYITQNATKNLTVYKYLNSENIYLTPNMTYYPRVIKKPRNTLVNGSVAILIPKKQFELSKKQMKYYSTDEYRKFYAIARNYQTRSLNIESNSVYFFGVLKENE